MRGIVPGVGAAPPSPRLSFPEISGGAKPARPNPDCTATAFANHKDRFTDQCKMREGEGLRGGALRPAALRKKALIVFAKCSRVRGVQIWAEKERVIGKRVRKAFRKANIGDAEAAEKADKSRHRTREKADKSRQKPTLFQSRLL